MNKGSLTILFFTFSRSDYASTTPVIKFISADNRFQVKLVAGGSHLLDRFGNSIDLIKADGFKIDHITEFLQESDSSPLELGSAYARLCNDLIAILAKENPDLLFILGDRWEMLAVASIGRLLDFPVVHHSGGDLTQGSADNQTRFAISTLAHLHLTAHEEHSERLKAVGEEAWRVKTVGEPALSHLQSFEPVDRDVFSKKVGIDGDQKFALATFHPTSFDDVRFGDQIRFFLSALDEIELPVIVTAPNPDVASNEFYCKLVQHAENNVSVYLRENLGVEMYYSAMHYAEFMVGNSSSGIWEAPSFSLPVINIGNRQSGRIRASNVIDIGYELTDLSKALQRVASSSFKANLGSCVNPYVQSECLEMIADFMYEHSSDSRLKEKIFIDPISFPPC